MRLFGSDRITNVMGRVGMEEGEAIEHPLITKSVERAQKKVEEITLQFVNVFLNMIT